MVNKPRICGVITTFLNSPALTRRYGLVARATIEQQYGLEQIMDRYVAMYHLLMKRRERYVP